MSRFSCSALAILAALAVSSGAQARTHHATPDAHASAAGASDMKARQQCNDMARSHWGTNSQDMQTPREHEYQACMFDHGMRNP